MIIKRLYSYFTNNSPASVAVEFALVSVFFLLPLMAGAVDFVIIMPAQAQLNTALQALYYFALTSPTNATNSVYTSDIISKINTASINQIAMPSTMAVNGTNITNGSLTYICYTTNASSPSFSSPSTSTCSDSTQTTMTFVNYKVTTTVALPIPLPGIGNSWTLSASGAVQTD